jgi:hypothetical protein
VLLAAGDEGMYSLDLKALSAACHAQALMDTALAAVGGSVQELPEGFRARFQLAQIYEAVAAKSKVLRKLYGTEIQAGDAAANASSGNSTDRQQSSPPTATASRDTQGDLTATGGQGGSACSIPAHAVIGPVKLVNSASAAAAMQLHVQACRVLAVDTEAFQAADALTARGAGSTLSLVQIGAPAAGK